MQADELQPFGKWEWTTAPERLLLPASHAGQEVVRVRYRERGTRLYRSFLLLEPPAGGFTPEAIVAAIEEHSTR
jgi:hypothetical protein